MSRARPEARTRPEPAASRTAPQRAAWRHRLYLAATAAASVGAATSTALANLSAENMGAKKIKEIAGLVANLAAKAMAC